MICWFLGHKYDKVKIKKEGEWIHATKHCTRCPHIWKHKIHESEWGI